MRFIRGSVGNWLLGLDRGENDGGNPLHGFKALREQGGVSMIESYVITFMWCIT
jgi:hypothetical protein